MVDNDEELTKIYLVAEDLTRPERYVAKAGSVVFLGFAGAWDHLLCPMRGDRVIYATHAPITSLDKFRNDSNTLYTYALRHDRVGWRRVEPSDLTAISVENACTSEIFPNRATRSEYSWINDMAKKLAEMRGTAISSLGKEFDSNQLRVIFELLPESLHQYLSSFITSLANARGMAEMKCTSYQNEISKLKKELQEAQLKKLQSFESMDGAMEYKPPSTVQDLIEAAKQKSGRRA